MFDFGAASIFGLMLTVCEVLNYFTFHFENVLRVIEHKIQKKLVKISNIDLKESKKTLIIYVRSNPYNSSH